jgi:hypothetical protein
MSQPEKLKFNNKNVSHFPHILARVENTDKFISRPSTQLVDIHWRILVTYKPCG